MTRIRSAKELGAAIRAARRRHGTTQAVLARKIGVSRKWLSEVESGKDTAQLGSVLRALLSLNLVLSVDSADATMRSERGGEIDSIRAMVTSIDSRSAKTDMVQRKIDEATATAERAIASLPPVDPRVRSILSTLRQHLHAELDMDPSLNAVLRDVAAAIESVANGGDRNGE